MTEYKQNSDKLKVQDIFLMQIPLQSKPAKLKYTGKEFTNENEPRCILKMFCCVWT